MTDQRSSAGVVVVRRSAGGWRYLLLRAYGYWDFPKGEVEPGEDPLEAARRELLDMSGKTHTLHTAVALATGGDSVWSHSETSTLVMRKLTPAFIGRYLAAAGEEVLNSVGAYQLESVGVQLFEKIEGDYFSILGLPLLPLLDALRRQGVIDG